MDVRLLDTVSKANQGWKQEDMISFTDAAAFVMQSAGQAKDATPATHSGLTEPLLSIVGGGLVAAILTLGFNAWWDSKKQKLAEDWEFKRYEANQIHFATMAIMEAYFAAKNELYYLTSTLESLLATLNQLAVQADAIVRQQGGPLLTVAQLDEKKRQLLQPFQQFNDQQVNLRWNQYELKAKENHTKAELQIMNLQHLVPPALHRDLVAIFERLSQPFVWDLPHGKGKLALLEGALPEIMALRERLMSHLEVKLGRG
jgi:hypothetical protein